MPRKYTFVTVAHGIDHGQLRLQAQSMALYCPVDLVASILIVENFDAGAAVDWQAGLIALYGPLGKLVSFVSAQDLAAMPLSIGGWWRQQSAKLAVASKVATDRYVVLDAKNQLVFPLTRAFLEASDGRPKLNGYGFTDHPLRDALQRTLTYLDVDPGPAVASFSRTSTPFVMITAEAQAAQAFVEQKSGASFGQTFLDARLTEFFLYAGFLERTKRLRTLYDFSQPHCAQIWGHSADEASCAKAVAQVSVAGACPFLAVHRVALANMDVIPRVIVGEFWMQRGLFKSVQDAVRFTITPNQIEVAAA